MDQLSSMLANDDGAASISPPWHASSALRSWRPHRALAALHVYVHLALVDARRARGLALPPDVPPLPLDTYCERARFLGGELMKKPGPLRHNGDAFVRC